MRWPFAIFVLVILTAGSPFASWANGVSVADEPYPTAARPVRKKEVQFRIQNELGSLFRMEQAQFNQAFVKLTLLGPAAEWAFQINRHWFVTAGFGYARFRNKAANSGRSELYNPRVGVKIVSSAADATSGHFFDDTRWWLSLDTGPYFTQIRSTLLNNNTGTDVGFGAGGGFDYFFHRHWGAGLLATFRYVHYNPDDYILFMFGPHLTWRF